MTLEELKNAATLGTVCKFSTYNSRWGSITGRIIGNGGYEIARSISDIINFNTQTQQSLGDTVTLPPIEDQEFFILKPESGVSVLAISYNWVDLSTFINITDRGTAKLTLLNVSIDDISNALTLLLENGYSVIVDTGA